MVTILVLAIFIASTCAIEHGHIVYNMEKNETLTEIRTFFKSSELTLTAPCPNNENITIFYSIKPYSCLLNDLNALSSEFDTMFRASTGLVMQCHNFVEKAVIPNTSFPETGVYVYKLSFLKSSNNVTLTVGHNYYGHLSPLDWPFLPFYSLMCGVYSVFAVVWLVLCCCFWKDLLRVQFWIGAVIFMGMLEKALFTGEYDNVRKYGTPTGSLLIAAEVVSSIKKTTSRMLIIIVSLGFGFIKPRLGTAMHKVTLVGLIFFVVSLCDGLGRIYNFKPNFTTSIVVYLVLSMTDAFIILWIFTSMMKTIRTLTMRKNIIKLTLYRHFRNVLIFFVFVSLLYTVWSSYQFKWTNCISDWADLWWDTAFWHLQFSVILLAIIILWRPSANNQRYAYSPLYDVDDDDETEWSNDATGVTKLKKGHVKEKGTDDENLKWVEENIPASRIDNMLSMVDSEEEMNQKVELNKMQ